MKVKSNNITSVSVILPTYNEAENIKDLITETVVQIVDFGVTKIEVIVVDDDSPDLTWKVASNVRSNRADVQIVRRTKDHGLTNSLNDGIRRAMHEVILWMDSDFSHPPEYIPQLLFMINQGYDIAVNSRYVIGGGEDRAGKGGVLQLFLSKMLNWGVRFLLKPSFSDYTSGFVAVRREVFHVATLRGDYGEYFVDFIFRMLQRPDIHICEMPYIALPRRSGESKTGLNFFDYMRRGRKYIWTVVRLRFLTAKGAI